MSPELCPNLPSLYLSSRRTDATVIYSLDPLVGTGIASTLLGEPFGPGTALGASLILGGCMCNCLRHGDEDETAWSGAMGGDREGGT